MVSRLAACAASLLLALSAVAGVPETGAPGPGGAASDSVPTDTARDRAAGPPAAAAASSPNPAVPAGTAPAAGSAAAPAADSASDPLPARASGAAPVPPPPDSARNASDTLAARERFLNTVTGSHQKAVATRWRERGPYPGAPLLLTLPAADFPYALRGGFDSPSMRQSLMASAALTQWADQSIAWLWSGAQSGFLRNLGTFASLGFYTWFSTYMPLGDAWLHEEWHRAVLGRRGIGSYNGIYHWNIGSDVIAVDHVSDRDLAALKDDHPAEFTRLMEAGGEGEIESVRLMRRRDFFLGRPAWPDRISWWTSGLNVSAYIWISSGATRTIGNRSRASAISPGWISGPGSMICAIPTSPTPRGRAEVRIRRGRVSIATCSTGT